MANHASAEKSARKTRAQTLVNRQRVSRINTYVKKVEALIAEGQKTDAFKALREAEKQLMKGVTKGVLKLNTAARKVSRLSKRVKGLAS